MHNPKRDLALAVVVGLAARALPLAFGVEHYGDSPVRIEAAEQWARAPHLWRGFTEAFQYGPLHLSLIGWLVALLGNRVAAARILSLVSGLLGIWLLGRLTLRHRDATSARWAMFALALSPMHIQSSTTGASEAVFLALFLGSLVLLEEDQVALSAVLLGAAGLVRYDGWLYVPLFAALLFLQKRDVPRALGFLVLALVPALGWMAVNARFAGDALAPIHHIDRDHRALSAMMFAAFGNLRWRAYGLVYWPFAICGVLSPGIGVLSIWGAFRALVRRLQGWELAAIAWLPIGYFMFRTSILGDFRPLARFAMVVSALSLVFAGDVLRRWLRAPVAALMVLWPVALGLACYHRNGGLAEWARPLSPISTVPPGIGQAAAWLREHAKPTDVVLLDGVWDYLDIPLAFEAGLPERQWIRAAWTYNFDERFRKLDPTLAVLIYQGKLGDYEKDRFDYRGKSFCVAQRYVYAAIYRRCG
jgi:4-amino-4-deoxy-L-arabinose transferase-like glycosyltransferase